MSEEEMLEQLYSLIEDRSSFILNNSRDCEIFKKDKLALEMIIESYKHDKLCLSGYRNSILRSCNQSLTKLSIFEDILKERQEVQSRLDKAIEYINRQAPKGYNFGWILENEELQKLLEILKGDSNE